MKKRIFSMILAMCLLLGCIPVIVSAATSGTCGDNVTWTLDDNGTLTINGTGDMTNYDRNNHSPFFDNDNIKSVIIESGITSIGDSALNYCDSLTYVIIPDSVTSIGNGAFSGCASLTSVTIPDSVTYIGESAFSNCTNLKNMTIPNSVTSIGNNSFYWCTSLTNVIIPNSVTYIGEHVFLGCTSLMNVTIPDSVTCIGDDAFYGCTSLTSINVDSSNKDYCSLDGILFDKDKTTLIQYAIGKENTSYTLPNSVTSIGDNAFQNCTSLTNVIIPNSVTYIGNNAFSDCTSLKNITIPNSVTYIGNSAFYYCENLTNMTIPDSITSIGYAAFFSCTSLTNVTIPNSVTSIEQDTFGCCTNLKNVTIPNSITYIGDNAFCNCTNLINITIPCSVTSIGNFTFDGCTNLTSVTIPNSVTSIGNYAFSLCTNLTNLTIPNSITSIGFQAFSGCENLTNLTISNNTTNIGNAAFGGCTKLTNVYFNGTEEQWKKISANAKITAKAKIHFGSGTSFTPVNANPSKPSGGSNYTYGTTNSKVNRPKDVRKNLKEEAERFNKAALEYTAAVAKSAKKQTGTEDDIESLADKLEQKKRITFIGSPDSNAKKAAYIGYAKCLNQMIEDIGLEKINLSENAAMIDYKLTNQILSKLRYKNLFYEYKGYNIEINLLTFSKSNVGRLEVSSPTGGKISAILASGVYDTMDDLQDFAIQLKEVAQDANRQALKIVVGDLVNLTGLADLGKLIARDGLKNYKPLKKLGYGDVAKYIKKCYSGYEAVQGILNCTKIETMDDIIDNPRKLSKKIANLYADEPSISNAVVDAAQRKLISSIYTLLCASRDYEKEVCGEEPTFGERISGFFEKTKSWVSSLFQCPVDFTVYNESGEMIGYVDDGAVYYNDDIYIEVNGDVKTLYVPVGMKVDIKMTGTDEGEFNYVVEEVIYNQPTGRLNYYGLPLSEGTEYTQALDTTEFANSTNVLPIASKDGDVLPNEYISSEDTTAYVIINADADNGGTVLGGGEYAKGDSVELSAVPADGNYEFNGWFVNDELVSTDNIYRFTAIENIDIHAEFIRVYNEDNAFDMQISKDVTDLYPYVYKDNDGSKGIVIVPFTDETADSMQIYVTAYAADGSILSNNMLYSSTLNENKIYVFENIDLENAARIVITDENKTEIASADYDSSKDIDNITIIVSDKYSDGLNVTARNENGNTVVNFDILDSAVNQDNITAYLARYAENGALVSCEILDKKAAENKIEFTAHLEDDCKLMFWDNDMLPITEIIYADF